MSELPEVVRLRDARGERPENAAGVGAFWYEPEIWALPLSPAARVLYAGLCSYLAHGEINRRDLRNTLRDHPDTAVADALDELQRAGLLKPVPGPAPEGVASYEVHSVKETGR